MNRVALVFVMAAGATVGGATAAHADSQASNPPFLGIEMSNGMTAGVLISKITPNTGAERAGLEAGDVVLEIDHTPIPPPSKTSPNSADFLSERITAHASGDEVVLRVIHDGRIVERTAVLSSRTDLMQQKIVGNPLDVPVVDVDSARDFNLDSLTGRTTIVGWSFRADGGQRCDDCARTLDHIDQRFKKLALADGPRILAVTNDTVDNVNLDRKALGSSMPTALVASDDATRTLEFADPRRLSLTVVDCQGIARFVAVILPGASDEDAVIDELVAAVEQANHRTRR
nr:PDZ domain-containing protein [Kofleriaceae bacterium]